MATKPTVRIPIWASGGTTADPGSKEITGWSVGERPAAHWWNWVLNSIGQWLEYLDTASDAAPVAVLSIATGYSGATTPSIIKQIGATASAIDQVASGTGDSGARIRIDYPTGTLASGPLVIGTVQGYASGDYLPYTINQKITGTANRVEFCLVDSGAGAPIDLDDELTAIRVNIAIYGRG